MKYADIFAVKRFEIMFKQLFISGKSINRSAMPPFEGLIRGDCEQMPADSLVFLRSVFVLVVVRCCTCPVDIYSVSVIVIPYANKPLNFVIVMKREGVNFNVAGNFAPVDMPAVILPELSEVRAGFLS